MCSYHEQQFPEARAIGAEEKDGERHGHRDKEESNDS